MCGSVFFLKKWKKTKFPKVEQMALWCFGEPYWINLTYLKENLFTTYSQKWQTWLKFFRGVIFSLMVTKCLLPGLLTMCTSVPFSHMAPPVAHQRATRDSTKPTRETWSVPSVRRTASATARAPPSVAARLASSGPRKTPRPWLAHVSTPESFTWVWLYSWISDVDEFVKLILSHQRAWAV